MFDRLRAVRVSPGSYRVIVVTTIAVFALITVTGAGVRLTGSGLGCEDWPTCNDGKVVAELDNWHSMIEFGNRMISGLVLIPVVGCVIGAMRRVPRRRDLIRRSWWLLAVLAVEIPLGGITVKMGLTPPIVAAHFLVSFALLAMAMMLYERAGSGDGPATPVVDPAVLRLSRLSVALATAVILSGTVVTGSGPHAGADDVTRLGYEVETVARIHSLLGWALLLAVTFTLGVAYRSGELTDRVRRRGTALTCAIVAQGAIGYAQYAAGVPAGMVALHVTGAVAVWLTLFHFHLSLWTRAPEVTESVHSSDLVGAGQR